MMNYFVVSFMMQEDKFGCGVDKKLVLNDQNLASNFGISTKFESMNQLLYAPHMKTTN
jgi:hypothetical protein